MKIIEKEAKSILRKFKTIDSWFVSRYGMNLYRGCLHNCVYCDGRAEKYQVEGDFGRDVTVKTNALEILKREIDPSRKRIPLKKGYVVLGGGVGDSYQRPEKKYQLTRKVIEILSNASFPIHILTKSTLVERDIDLLAAAQRKNGVLVSISFSTVDDKLARQFEPGVPAPSERLKALAKLKQQGIPCGMFLMPVIPLITDTSELIDKAFAEAAKTNLDYLIFSGMTLKPGKQQEYFFSTLGKLYPDLEQEYRCIYAQAGQWGNASSEYYQALNQRFAEICRHYSVPSRIPIKLVRDHIEGADRAVVILEQIDYLLKLTNQSSPYGYGAYSLSQLKQPIEELNGRFQHLKGIGPVTERIINEILDTGTCRYYEKLIGG